MDFQNEHNQELYEFLELLGNYYVMNSDTYRAKTFLGAASKIRNYPTVITSGEDVRKTLTGIGASTEREIDEFLSTGTSARLEELESKFKDQKVVIDYFRSFYGIGPAKAIQFYNQGLRTLEDLWEHGDLTEAQRIGILWRDHLTERISRDEIDVYHQRIGELLDPYEIRWDIAGSYRRGESSSGDIDLFVQSHPELNMEGLIYLLEPIITATLAEGPTKFMGICRLDEDHFGHRLDIRLIDAESYPAALMYFTGSQRFNILMRQQAISLGYTLNEYGLYDRNEHPQVIATESDIFKILRVKYMSPEERIRHLDRLPIY